jgi:hypothetical protein
MLVVRRSAVQQQPVLFLLTGEEVNSTARGCGYVHTVEIDAALADTRRPHAALFDLLCRSNYLWTESVLCVRATALFGEPDPALARTRHTGYG